MAVTWLVLATIANSDYDTPVRYLNEAAADYFTGQVAGGADYGWAGSAGFISSPDPHPDSYFCAPQNATGSDTTPNCWETNLTGIGSGAKDPASIGRIATMLYDAADDANAVHGSLGVQRGDAWAWSSATVGTFPLVYTENSYLKSDFENVSIGGDGIRTFAHHIADQFHVSVGLGDLISLLGDAVLSNPADLISHAIQVNVGLAAAYDGLNIYRSLSDTMKDPHHGGYSWCDRCSVLATHKPGATNPETGWTAKLFKDCRDDSLLASALNQAPPDPALNINRTTCTACPAGTAHNADYSACVPCNSVVVGDKCELCPADIVVDGMTFLGGNQLNFPSNTPQPEGDACPNILWVEVTNVDGLFAADPDTSLAGQPDWGSTRAGCTRSHTLYEATQSGTDSFVYSTHSASGTMNTCPVPPLPPPNICVEMCTGIPSVNLVAVGNTVKTLRLGIAAGGPEGLSISSAQFIP